MRHVGQVILDLQSSNPARAWALSEKSDALWRVEAATTEKHDALIRVKSVEASWSTRDLELQEARCTTGELPARQVVELR